MICLQLEIDPLSGDIVCASETEAAILHATLGLVDVHLCHFLDRAPCRRKILQRKQYILHSTLHYLESIRNYHNYVHITHTFVKDQKRKMTRIINQGYFSVITSRVVIGRDIFLKKQAHFLKCGSESWIIICSKVFLYTF